MRRDGKVDNNNMLNINLWFLLSMSDRDIPMGHSPRGNPPDVEWEPYFCVLNQLDQTFTSYRSEEMSLFMSNKYQMSN
ncbi:putative Ras GTPase-activating protein [Orchesella cincta]|uniref:Putative Ras GTPase-activating protein n=1 Tax=Orchesella cincta TaxID=48709 RepID=A0A1D2MP31_ORCCI|nr:putative Ras GTPase-activating protein [Orchesella cincta]